MYLESFVMNVHVSETAIEFPVRLRDQMKPYHLASFRAKNCFKIATRSSKALSHCSNSA